MTVAKVNLAEKLAAFDERFSPKIVAYTNDDKVQVAKVESQQAADYEANVERMAQRGCKVVFAVGFVAGLAPEDARWNHVRGDVVAWLTAENPLQAVYWADALTPHPPRNRSTGCSLFLPTNRSKARPGIGRSAKPAPPRSR